MPKLIIPTDIPHTPHSSISEGLQSEAETGSECDYEFVPEQFDEEEKPERLNLRGALAGWAQKFRPRSSRTEVRRVAERRGSNRASFYDLELDYSKPARPSVKSVVDSTLFDTSMSVLILINAVLVGAQTEYSAVNLTEEMPFVYNLGDKLFCGVFTVELLLRIWATGAQNFYLRQWSAWNYMDTVMVAVQLVEVATWVVAFCERSSSGAGTTSRFGAMRVLRVLRVVRIMRLLRVMHLVTELRTILLSIAGALRSLCWTILLLFGIMYIVGIYLTQVVTDHFVMQPDLLASQGGLRVHCGSVMRTICTLYMSITGGMSWEQLARPLGDNIGQSLWVVMWLYTAFCIFCMMNIVTGVFVEGASRDALRDKEGMMMECAMQIFHTMDVDCSGLVSEEDFKRMLSDDQLVPYFRGLGIDPMRAYDLFKLSDRDNCKQIQPEAFLASCMATRGNAQAIDLASFLYEFRSSWKMLDRRLNRLTHMVRSGETKSRSADWAPGQDSPTASGASACPPPSAYPPPGAVNW